MMERKNKKVFSFYLILLLICLFSSPLQTNSVVREDYEDDYFSNQKLLSALFEKLYELESNKQGKVNIVHIGDSHIQGDYFTGTIRSGLQKQFGNGGYGFSFPYALSGTSGGSRSVRYISNVKWDRLLNISPTSESGVGLGGVELYTSHPNWKVQLSVDNEYAFNKVKVIYPSIESPFKFSLLNDLATTPDNVKTSTPSHTTTKHLIERGETLSSIARQYKLSVKNLMQLNNLDSDKIQAGKELDIEVSPVLLTTETKDKDRVGEKAFFSEENKPYSSTFTSDSLLNKVMLLPQQRKGKYNLNGFVLENNNPGLIYHSIGVNGAKISDFNKYPLFFKQLPILEPDLIVLSFGTNESYGKLSTENYLNHLKKMISNIEKENPNATILVMTPPPSMFRHNRINPYISDYSLALVGLNNVPVWDLYSRMGGIESISDKDGKYSDLIARDKVHYKIKGYEKQGDLFLSDFLNAYEKYKRNIDN